MSLLSEIVFAHRAQLRGLIEVRGVGRMRKIYAESRIELEEKLAALKRRGRGSTFTAQQLSQVLAQVGDAAKGFESGLADHLADSGRRAAALAPRHLVRTMSRMEARYGRTTPVVQAAQAAVAAGAFERVAPSLLAKHRSSVRTYGTQTVEAIQRRLALSLVQGESTDEAVDRVVGAHGLFEDQRWRAERIVRTEMAYSYGVANQAAMMELKPRVPRLMKKLVEIVPSDGRTGQDSIELNGQTVEVHQPFLWRVKDSRGRPTGKVVRYMQPPNRPNDRATVIPWQDNWEGVAALGPPGDQA